MLFVLAEINSLSILKLWCVKMSSSKATLPSAQVFTFLGGNTRLTLLIGTIVHPKATIFAIAGPIVIGANCIIEEAAIIVNR